MFESVKKKEKKVFEALKGKYGYSNVMQAPRLVKVSVGSGVGSVKDKEKVKVIEAGLTKITGQKSNARLAKKSIAGFKSREGDVSGYQVTLRGSKMYDFLDRLIHLAFPRTKDFRGIDPKCIDDIGNVTIGIKEHTIFPETSDEELRNVFGMGITIVTTSKNKAETLDFIKFLGFPMKEVK